MDVFRLLMHTLFYLAVAGYAMLAVLLIANGILRALTAARHLHGPSSGEVMMKVYRR
jgi:uncharacterized membrane protein HdeD (DUF308 family)